MDNLIEMPKLSGKMQNSLPPGYVSLAQLLELKQSQKGKYMYCEEGSAGRCSFKNFSEQWRHTDLDEAERIEDGPQDKNGRRQRGFSGSKDRAPDKNEQNQRLNSGNNDQGQDRIEQRHKMNLETERTPEQLQRWNSGNNNIAPDKSIRKDNHARVNRKTKSKEIIGGVSLSSTYKTQEMEKLNQVQTVPGLAGKSEDISRKQLQIQSCKVCERLVYSELKVNAGHKVNNGITGRIWQWHVKASPEAVKVTRNDFHTCQQLKNHESNGMSASDGNTGRANQIKSAHR